MRKKKEKQKKPTYWTEARCRNEAKKYRRATDFRFCAPGAYSAAQRNGWLMSYDWFRRGRKWTREECWDVALKCHTRRELKKVSGGVYNTATKNGWIDDYWWFVEWDKVKDKWGKTISEAIKIYVEKGLDGCKEEYRKRSEDENENFDMRKLYKYMSDCMTDKWFSWSKLNWYFYYPEKRRFQKKEKHEDTGHDKP